MRKPENTIGSRRDERGRWLRGTTGNAGGRRPEIAGIIRQRTRDGEKLVAMLLEVTSDTREATRDRLAATKVLLDYAFAKPVPNELTRMAEPVLTLEAARGLIASACDSRSAED